MAHEAEFEARFDRLRQMQKLESPGLLAGGVAHEFHNQHMAILSMASVFGIMRAHRGHIWIDSQPGIGAAVRLAFPAQAPPPPDAEG